MVCRAYRVNDQMLCPCGKQWDVTDTRPECAEPIHADRAEYLAMISQMYGVKPVKRVKIGDMG